MIDLGPHALFIILAWGVAVLVATSLVAWVMVDHRIQRRRLAALEQAKAEAKPRLAPAGGVTAPGAS